MNKKQISSIAIVLIVASTLMVSGALFQYMWKGRHRADVGVVFEYDKGSGWENAEDLWVNTTPTGLVAGESATFLHNWRVSSDLDVGATIDLNFIWTPNLPADAEGFNFYVYFDDGTTNTTIYQNIDGTPTENDIIGLSAGDTGTIYIVYSLDDNVIADIYDIDYVVSYTYNAP